MDRHLRSILSETPAGRQYLADLDKSKRLKSARLRSRSRVSHPKPTKGEREAKADARQRKVYAAVDKRAGGACEFATSVTCCLNDATEHDHFWGRGKAEETPENVWHLCKFHHDRKTLNEPSRLQWLQWFRDHCFRNDFLEEQAKCDRAIALEQAQRRTPSVPVELVVSPASRRAGGET